MTSPPLPASGPCLDEAIAHAERRRLMLEGLADMGMRMAQEIYQRWSEGPYHPEPRHDQGRSFAVVSRAVRLTLALEARMDEQIIALRNGVMPGSRFWTRDPAAASSIGREALALTPDEVDNARHPVPPEPVEGFEQEADGRDTDADAPDGACERLMESESDEALLAGDFDACVDVIRASLGLSPASMREKLAAPSARRLDVGRALPDIAPVRQAPEPHLRSPRDREPTNSAPLSRVSPEPSRERAAGPVPRKGTGEEYG